MELKFQKLNQMMKYIVLTFFLAIALTMMGVGINAFVSIIASIGLVALGGFLCLMVMRHENNKMRKMNEKMMQTRNMDGYVEEMEKIGKRTVWMNIYHQTLLNRGTAYINMGEYKKSLEIMDELQKYKVNTEVRFLEVWNRLFALIELRNYGQVQKLMKQYQPLLDAYSKASESIGTRLELFRYMAAGDNVSALEKVRECRAACGENDQSAVDQLDFYEVRLCQLTGDLERAEELKKALRSRDVLPCIAKNL